MSALDSNRSGQTSSVDLEDELLTETNLAGQLMRQRKQAEHKEALRLAARNFQTLNPVECASTCLQFSVPKFCIMKNAISRKSLSPRSKERALPFARKLLSLIPEHEPGSMTEPTHKKSAVRGSKAVSATPPPLLTDEQIIQQDFACRVPKTIKKNIYSVPFQHFQQVKRDHMSAKRTLELNILKENKKLQVN